MSEPRLIRYYRHKLDLVTLPLKCLSSHNMAVEYLKGDSSLYVNVIFVISSFPTDRGAHEQRF